MANTNKKRIHFAFLDKFEKQIAQLKKFASHIGLYLGLFLYTLVGAWIFILIEHPVEKEKLETIQGKIYLQQFLMRATCHMERWLKVVTAFPSCLTAKSKKVRKINCQVY